MKFGCGGNFRTKEIRNFVEKSVEQTLKILKLGSSRTYISVFLTNNKKIKRINLKFRNINKETNVLSFPQNEERMLSDLENYFLLGDIVISMEKILSEANEQKKSFFNHLQHMIVHSILHLNGYDHTNKKDTHIMEKKEEEIMMKLSLKL